MHSSSAALAAPIFPLFSKVRPEHPLNLRWEPAYLDRLHELRLAGFSLGAAAAVMGVSRNSTIGAAYRARAAGDRRFADTDYPKSTVTAVNPGSVPYRERKASPKPKSRPRRAPSPQVDIRVLDLLLFSVSARADAFAPPSRRLMCWEVGPRDCRYIAGSDRTMCGHAVTGGSAWCGFHRPLTLSRAA